MPTIRILLFVKKFLSLFPKNRLTVTRGAGISHRKMWGNQDVVSLQFALGVDDVFSRAKNSSACQAGTPEQRISV